MSSLKGQQPTPSSSLINNSVSSSSSSVNNWRLTVTPQISGNASWKTNNRVPLNSRIFPTQQQPQQTITQTRMYLLRKLINMQPK